MIPTENDTVLFTIEKNLTFLSCCKVIGSTIKDLQLQHQLFQIQKRGTVRRRERKGGNNVKKNSPSPELPFDEGIKESALYVY